MIGNKLIL